MKTKKLLSLFLAICFSSWGVSAVKETTATSTHLADSISGIRAHKAILSYKGEPVCVANATSSLTPSFLSVDSGAMEKPFKEESDLPQCNTEDMNRIYNIAQNSILVNDPEKGVETAATFIPYVALCGVSALTGGIISASAHFVLHYQAKSPEFVSISSGLMGGVIGEIFANVSADVIREKNKMSKLGELIKKPGWKKVPLAITCGIAGGLSVQYLLEASQ